MFKTNKKIDWGSVKIGDIFVELTYNMSKIYATVVILGICSKKEEVFECLYFYPNGHKGRYSVSRSIFEAMYNGENPRIIAI